MNRIITILFLAVLAVAGRAQNGAEGSKSLILPGTGRLDVERMNTRIDTGMDISGLTLSELRVLRNAFAARQGYPFLSAELRSLFSATSWYDSVYWERSDKVNAEWDSYNGPSDTADYRNNYLQVDGYVAPLKYTADEQAFIKRLKAREDELRALNFAARKGEMVNMDNIINPYQMAVMPEALRKKLARNGFAIVTADNLQMFHVYERNDYHVFPNFVTTDIFMQLFHLYFDCMLRDVEQQRLFGATSDFVSAMEREMAIRAERGNGNVRDAAEYCAAYFAVARALLDGSGKADVTGRYAATAAHEMERIAAETDDVSDFIDGYGSIKFGYSLFRPRGHYTRTDTLGRYFRAMMWLQTVPFGTDSELQMRRAMTIADAVGSNAALLKAYRRLTEPITFLMGCPDNITVTQLYDEMKATGKPLAKLFGSNKDMARLRAAVEAIGERQTRIRPKFERTSHCKINLMPQRYMPDAEVLQEMVDYDTDPTLRDVPRGLDVMAAMRWSAAERILVDEMGEADRWSGYAAALDSMKRRMNGIDWSETVATRRIESLTALNDTAPQGVPYFMLTPQWQKKSLNAALASWAELKHDALLYGKQPIGAECGGGGPPSPVTKGYVEPAVAYWRKAIALLDATHGVLDAHGLLTEKCRAITSRVRDEAEFLLRVSEKELSGSPITNEEYDQIRIIGSRFEYISLDMLREPGQYLDSWTDVQGPDKSIALIADVYTANADNNPPDRHSILYEGTGPADEIYVVVEIDGYLYLTRGAVFSYRELQRSINEPRLTDEEWQKMLKKTPDTGRPEWMKEITVPQDERPEDNEQVFYSSGC